MRWTSILACARSIGGWLLLCLLLFVAPRAYAQAVPADQGLVPDSTELRALRQFYYATGGPQWYRATNWLQGTTLADAAFWTGVTVENGDVTGLNLSYMFSYKTSLKGPISTAVGQFAQLRYLFLVGNQLSGDLPTEWRQLAQLQVIDLASNYLSGSLPAGWGHLTQLQYLDLSGNQLSGSLPTEWRQLAQLQELNLPSNHLSGSLLAEWSQLAQLQRLDLSGNQLSGSLPAEWSHFAQLQDLFLSINHLSGSLPAEWSQLTRLQNLDLAYNQLSGELPAEWGHFARLQELSLSYNYLSGNLPTEWRQLAQLQYLFLTANQLSGGLPAEWSHFAQLQYLDISTNQLSGDLPAEWSQLTRLQRLDLAYNHLSGGLPAGWGHLAQLKHLNLAYNHLSGGLSAEWSQLAQLQDLDISTNQLSGNLPAEWSHLAQLQRLDISTNQLSGWLPTEWSHFAQLQYLLLASNQLSGELPAEWGHFARLSYLLLDTNQLSGLIPAEVLSLSSLSYASLSNNKFTALPANVNSSIGILYTDNNQLDFTSLEPYFTGPGVNLFSNYFGYSPQTLPQDERTLNVTTGQPASIPSAIGGVHTHYQWQRQQGTSWANLAGATSASYRLPAVSLADAGRYRCQATNDWVTGLTLTTRTYVLAVQEVEDTGPRNLPDDTNTGLPMATLTPAPDSAATKPADVNYVRTWTPRVALTTTDSTGAVPPPPPTGALLREQWNKVDGYNLDFVPFFTAPASTSYRYALEGPTDIGEQYGDRMRGYLTPELSGTYSFWIAGDNNSELWLSTDEDPAHAVRLAYVIDYTSPREWHADSTQHSGPVALVAGRRYYVEVRHFEGGGGDHVAVGWTRPDHVFEGPIAGHYLSPAAKLPVGPVRREEWSSVLGDAISDIPLSQPPTFQGYVPTLAGPTNWSQNYGARLSAYVVAPQSGTYSFWVAGDDAAELWLSPDKDPAHKQRLAYTTTATGERQWQTTASQHSGPVALVAGQRYYVEVLHKESGGEDYVAAGWTLPDGTFEGPIAGPHLAALGSSEEPTWTVEQAQIATQYLDGLGRPVQTVLHQASPSRRDMVQPQAYDGLGREPRQYLPYPADTAGVHSGGYRYQALTDQQTYYARTGPSLGTIGPLDAKDPASGVARTGRAFAETQFEASPLNRVLQQGAAGEAWQLTAGHAQTRLERPNTPQDSVPQFALGNDPRGRDSRYVGFYPAGELWGEQTSDEQGSRTISWKDKLGQVVLKQVESSRPDTSRLAPRRWLRTAYAYDDFQRLRFVLQPEGTRRVLALPAPSVAPTTGAAIAPFVFGYAYDGRGRQIAKQVPGQDAETVVVYDQLDRPVLSQDAQQRTRREWSFTKYDALGRAILTGLVTRQDTAGLGTLQAIATADTATSHQYEQRTADVGRYPSYPQHYTTDQAFPRLGQDGFSIGQVLTLTCYDDYDFDNDGQPDIHYDTAADAAFPNGQAPVADELRTQGLPTITFTRVLGAREGDTVRPEDDQNAWLIAATFYDERARPIQVKSSNIRKGIDLVTTQLDFLGKVVQSITRHQGPNLTAPLQVAEFFTYDHMSRLRTTRQQLPGEAQPSLLSVRHYNELGQLLIDSLGTGRLAQKVDYAYNIRGWLTSLNDPFQPNADDLFNLSLHYERGFTKGYEQYNGNLTGQTWRGRDGVQRAYGYVYDPLNRLLQGDFVARAGGSAGTLTSATAWNTELDNYRLNFVSYDDNGNINTLRRRGLLKSATHASSKQYGAVDNLSYAYVGNRLQAVNDSVSGNQLPQPTGYHGAPTSLAGDFQEQGVKLGQEYLYDANGNLTADKNKGITRILYNHLNLPRQIQFGQGADSLVFRYAATGQKVTKLVYQTGKPTPLRTDYLGPFQYEQDSLKFFPHAEGRVLRFVSKDAANQAHVSYQREFTIKDHLGNLRLAYRLGQRRTYSATLEQDAPTHQGEVQHFDSLSVSPPVAQDMGQVDGPNLARTGMFAAKLNAGDGSPQPLGPLTQFGVQRGDTVTVTAYGLYPRPQAHSFLFSLASFLTGLLHPASPPPPGLDGRRRQDLPLLQVGVAAGLASIPQLSGGVPQGYLRLLVFNQDSALVSQQVQQLTQAANGSYEPLRLQVVLPQDGYVTAYVGNESDVDVYFDDVSIEHRQGLQVQETQYDPWGLYLSGVNYTSQEKNLNNFTFNGIERNKSLNINTYDAVFRVLDSQIGRWWSIDPKPDHQWSLYSSMNNNPILNQDALGDTITARSDWTVGGRYIFNNFFRNAMEGRMDPERNGSMSCLNALASNLSFLYGSPTKPAGDFVEAMNGVGEQGHLGSREVAAPTLNGKRLTSANDVDDFRSKDFNTGIVDNLNNQMKGHKGTFVFGVGLAYGYHSTIITAFNNGQVVTDADGNKTTATSANPMFLFVEDNGGARVFNSQGLESKLKEYYPRAASYYSGSAEVGGRRVNNNSAKNMNAIIYNLEFR